MPTSRALRAEHDEAVLRAHVAWLATRPAADKVHQAVDTLIAEHGHTHGLRIHCAAVALNRETGQ